MPGKLCTGSTLVIGVQLQFMRVSAFHPLVLEIRVGTFFCACSCRWPTPSDLVFDASATTTITSESQMLCKSICEVVQKQIFNGLDWRQYYAGVNKVHGLIFFNFLQPVNNNSSDWEKFLWTVFWPTRCICEKWAANVQLFCISAKQINIYVGTLAFTLAS